MAMANILVQTGALWVQHLLSAPLLWDAVPC